MDEQLPNKFTGGYDLLTGPEDQQRPGGDPMSDTVPWGWRDVLIVIALVILTFILTVVIIPLALALVSAFLPDFDSSTLGDSVAVNVALTFLQWVIVLGVTLIYLKVRGYPINARMLGFRRTRFWRALGLLIVVLAITLSFEIIYNLLILNLFGEGNLPSDVPSQQVTSLFGTSVAALVLTFVMVALITPLVEELFFRGFVHRGLEQQFGFLAGGSLSATIFMVAHFDLRLFPPIFVLGFGLAYLVHRTGSIWSSISAHFLINALGVISQFLDLGGG
ncbi:MAG: CPBP family intramembrane glutamic endopeptidase [Thermoleophilia bacterium]